MGWNNIIPAELLDKEWKDMIDAKTQENLTKSLPGNPIGFVVSYLRDNHVEYRIVRDGKEQYIVTDDFVPMRANLEIDNDFVRKVTWG